MPMSFLGSGTAKPGTWAAVHAEPGLNSTFDEHGPRVVTQIVPIVLVWVRCCVASWGQTQVVYRLLRAGLEEGRPHTAELWFDAKLMHSLLAQKREDNWGSRTCYVVTESTLKPWLHS